MGLPWRAAADQGLVCLHRELTEYPRLDEGENRGRFAEH